MSTFSGKCDLCDTILMLKTRGRDGEERSVADPNYHGPLYSDEKECFEIFKKKTNGVIYQHQRLELTPYNLDKEIQKSEGMLKKIKTEDNGKRKFYYEYNGVRYNSLKALNKKGYYCIREIHFNELLDIIPYYPYIVTIMVSDGGTMKVFISSESYVDTQERESRVYGMNGKFYEHYRNHLQRHYIEVIEQYYNRKDREKTKTIHLDSKNLVVTLGEPLDDYWPVSIEKNSNSFLIYSSPKIIDKEKGILSFEEVFLGEVPSSITIKYVAKGKTELFLV